MQAVTASRFTDPSGYELTTVPIPKASSPSDVVVRVRAASVNPVDVKLANGLFKHALPEKFPLRIGYDVAGVVSEIGSSVSGFKVGDKVWSRLPEVAKGSWAEYVKCPETHLSLMPERLSFEEAAALPLAALTCLQALRRYNGTLEGKTVFIPAGLGGTGAFGCQLAKRVFRAGKVITTVSTSKVPKIPEYLGEGVVDQIIDYTKQDPMEVIPKGSIDFMLDTMGQAMQCLSLMKPRTGTIVSISTLPSATQLQEASFFRRPDRPVIPFVPRLVLNTLDYICRARAWRWGVSYTYIFLDTNQKDFIELRKIIDDGKLRSVVGSTTDLRDIDKVKAECTQVYQGKGGIGKTVFVISASD